MLKNYCQYRGVTISEMCSKLERTIEATKPSWLFLQDDFIQSYTNSNYFPM